MATGLNTFEGGAEGTTVTTGNSGGSSGTAAATVSIATSDTIVYSAFSPAHGNLGVEMAFAAAGTGATRIMWNIAEAGRVVFSFYYRLITLPTALEDVAGIRHASGNMTVLAIGTDGKLILNNAAGSGISASRAAATIPVDQQIRIDIAVQKGTTTSDGYMGYAYYLGSSNTPIFTWESSVQNTGTANVAQAFIGRSTGRVQANKAYYDTVRWEAPKASGFLTSYVAPASPPTVSLGPDLTDIEPFETVTLTASALDADGTITNYAFSQLSGPTTIALSGTDFVRTYEAPGLVNGGTYVFSVEVTDNDSQTASTTVTHTILSASEFAVGIGGILIPIKITSIAAAGFGGAPFGTSSFGG